jgi:hypothetical protein
MLNNPGIIQNDPGGPLARLGLGRAYALEAASTQEADAARAKSRTAYQDFFCCGKTPTPMSPS